jgi:regulator of sigma E protease
MTGGSPAQRAGIEVGDRITAVNGEPVHQFYDLLRLIGPHPGEELILDVERDGSVLQLEVTPEGVAGKGKIGIRMQFPTELRKLAVGEAFSTAWQQTVDMTFQTLRVLGGLLTFRMPMSQISGPIEIARISGEAAKQGIRPFIWFLGVISLQLGIFNVLPIPVLDGGHLAIIAVESVIRRDFSLKVKERILEVGFYLLMALVVVVLFNDTLKNRVVAGLFDKIFG